MSLAQSILDRIKVIRQTMLEIQDKNSDKLAEIGKENNSLFNEIAQMEGGAIIHELMGKMEDEPDDEECSRIINDFKGMDPIKQEMVVNLMHIVVKMGKLQEASDQENRERWSNRVTDAFNS